VLTIVLAGGQGALFPNPTGAQFFYATIIDDSNNIEIVKCTARSTDTLTVVRAQDGTSARSFSAADRVELRPCKAIHDNYPQLDTANTFVGDQTVTGNLTASGDLTAQDDLFVTDDATIGGDQTIGGTLTVTGTIACANLSTMAGRKIDALNASVGMLFRQASVPTGWTKSTTYNDAAIRIVSGTPSQKADAGDEFTTLLGARTILNTYLPDHTITITDPGHTHDLTFDRVSATGPESFGSSRDRYTTTTDAVAGAKSNTTGITAAFGNTARGGAQATMPFDVNYVDVYLATKDA
jgi:hypothetical protein